MTALCIEQSDEWLAGRVHLDRRKLDAATDDQLPHAAVVTEEVKNMAASCPRTAGGTKAQRSRAVASHRGALGPSLRLRTQ